jgi:hypothetical protein
MKIRFPRTLKGWRTLFWLTLGRCPIDHSRLIIDGSWHDIGGPGYCFKCDGIAIWPRSGIDALYQNYMAEKKKLETRS